MPLFQIGNHVMMEQQRVCQWLYFYIIIIYYYLIITNGTIITHYYTFQTDNFADEGPIGINLHALVSHQMVVINGKSAKCSSRG